ncbi:MAG TPA: hypothetical protein P5013_03335 [Methanoregula sp.]|nr:hypothetical protein [Methanoregula sp.]
MRRSRSARVQTRLQRPPMAGRSRKYIWQFTIGLGFLSGLWTAIGNDPGDVVLNLLGKVTGDIYPDPAVRQATLILPTVLLLISVRGAYRRGKVPGLGSVLIGYMAGLALLVSLPASLVLLLAAIMTGYLATSRHMF